MNITVTSDLEGGVEDAGAVHHPSRPFNNPNPFVPETLFRGFFLGGCLVRWKMDFDKRKFSWSTKLALTKNAFQNITQ